MYIDLSKLILFQDNIDEFMAQSENENADKVLKRLDEQHQKYKFMEFNLESKKRRLVDGAFWGILMHLLFF